MAFLSTVNGKVNFHRELKKVLAAQEASTAAFMALKDELDHWNSLKLEPWRR